MSRRFKDMTDVEQQHVLQQAREVWTAWGRLFRTIGTTPAERLVWLEAWSRRDLTNAESAALELQVFLIHHANAWAAGSTGFICELEARHQPPFVAAADVPAVQRAIRALLQAISPGTCVPLSQSVGDALLWHPTHGVRLVTQSFGEPQVFAAVADLLMQIGPRLRRCKTADCHKLFAANRPGQVRCTKTCGEAERQRAWRAAHRQHYAERQHQQYVKRVRAQRPRVRVTRRPKRKAG